MHRAAICGPRGQVAASAAAGAPASALPSPTRRAGAPPSPTSSFFCASRTRTRSNSINWRGPGSWSTEGATVTDVTRSVTTSVTAKSLVLHGFGGSFRSYRPEGDIHVQARAHGRMPIHLSVYGNISNNRYSYSLSVAYALLGLLLQPSRSGTSVTAGAPTARASLWPNKIGGGYSSDGRQSADQHLERAGRREKFWGSATWAGSMAGDRGGGELAGLAGSGAGGNGGFPPFFGGGDGGVGTVALEWSAQGLGIAGFSGAARKLAQLTSLALAGELGADRGRRGGTPPIARSALRSMLAQTFFRIWIEDRAAARPASLDRTADGSERAQTLTARMGLGVSGFAGARTTRSGRPRRSGSVDRVGDGRSSVGRPDELRRLCRGGDHVNA